MGGGNSAQHNKRHKSGKHASKGQRHKHREQKAGKHIIGRASSKPSALQQRADRLAAARAQRDTKRAEVMTQKRSAFMGAPKVVSLLLLSDDVDIGRTWSLLLTACEELNGSSAVSTIGAGTLLKPAAAAAAAAALVGQGGADGGGAESDMDDLPDEAPMLEGAEEGLLCPALAPRTSVVLGKVKVRVTWLPPPRGRVDPLEVMEVGKTSDVVLLCVPGSDKDVAVDSAGEMALQTLMAMGMPAVIGLAAPSINRDLAGAAKAPSAALKDRSAMKKHVSGTLGSRIAGDTRVLPLVNLQDAVQVVRALAELPPSVPVWRQKRPQVMVESARIESHAAAGPGPSAGGQRVTLRIEGYVRSLGVSANQAIHISGAGDFNLDRITAPTDPHLPRRAAPGGAGAAAPGSDEALVMVSDPATRESLVRENFVDTLAGEQTWPTEEEMREAEAARKGAAAPKKRRVPKGMSAYQAAWIPDEYDDEEEEEEGGEEDDGMQEDEIPDAEHDSEDEESEEEMVEIADDAGTDILGGDDDDDEDEDGPRRAADPRAEREAERRRRSGEEGDDLEFPDEVETPHDVAARTRFDRYRGLKSFRSSPWDPKESLPHEYAKVFAFENFRRTQRRAVAAAERAGYEDPGAAPGQYAALHVSDVPLEVATWIVGRTEAAARGEAPPVVAYGLLQHECKLSVVHLRLKKAPGYEDPIRSKDPLLLSTGVRTFTARPVFSSDEHRADKYKMEKFLHSGRYCVASIYGPIMYPPLPVLAYKLPGEGGGVPQLVASGAVKSVDPDRIVLKKIILTGYPVRVHKRRAVVKHMFYNPEDVKWFRPLEVYTKYGRRGRITEPVGTKGTMKVIFDGSVQQRDTVCLSLYKRVFPKWPETMDFC